MPYWISCEHAYTVNAVHINTFCNLWFTQMKHVSAVGAHVVRVFTAFLFYFIFSHPQQFGLNALKLLPLRHIKVWSTVRVCVYVPVRDPSKNEEMWMADTYVSDTLNSHPSVTRSHRTLPTLDRKTCAHTHTHPRMPYTRIIICVTRHQTVSNTWVYKLHPLYTLFVHRTEHALYTQNRTWLSHTEQNIPFTHRTRILFTNRKEHSVHTEQSIMFTQRTGHVIHTQSRTCCSHTEQRMLFVHRTVHAVRTQYSLLFAHNRVCCSHTEQSKLFAYNRACCSHTTGRAICTQTEHSVHTQNKAHCSMKLALQQHTREMPTKTGAVCLLLLPVPM